MNKEKNALLKVTERIRNNRQPIGSRIPSERLLAEELKISRNTLRSALRTLEARGIVEIRRGSGCYILSKEHVPEVASCISEPMGAREVEEYFEARLILESVIARLAAERLGEEDLEKLEHCLVRLSHALLHQNIPEIMKEGEEFRLAMARASKNEFLFQSIKILHGTYSRILFIHQEISEAERNDCFACFVDLYNALKAQDGERAELFVTKCTRRLMEQWKVIQERQSLPPGEMVH